MIKAILVDDELHCMDTLALLLTKYCPDVQIVDQCSSAKSALTSIEKNNPDLLFLDIEMPVMNAFEFLDHVGKIKFALIFTTSYDQYALKAIRFAALDYLLKPIDSGELMTALQRVRCQRQFPYAEQFEMLLGQMQQKVNGFMKIAVPTFEGFELIPADQIISCEADGNYTCLFLKNKTKITACRTLKDIEEQLAPFSSFIRIHHSYIVNLNEVSRYVRGEGGYVVMSNDAHINVSRSRKEALVKYF